MTWLWRWLAPLVLLGSCATRALAHDADILYVRPWRPVASGREVRERVTLTGDSLARLVPLDAARGLEAARPAIELGVWDAMPLSAEGGVCLRTATSAAAREGYVELEARFTCPPGALRQRFSLLAVLPPTYKVVLGGVDEGEAGQRFADAAHPTLGLGSLEAGSGEGGAPAASGLLGWVGLGLGHIFQGADHLAFLLGVLVVGGSWRRVLGVVTAFTLAHSLTLGATALGWLVLDDARGRWVEAAIAASIVWVAVENLAVREPRHRAALTFAFGLVHGLGFASVLRGYGLGDSVARALLGFNLGVELGQALVVLALLPLVRLVRRRPALYQRTVRTLSGALLALGGYWLLERAFALIG
jgi:hypothetical protein